jgi:hypothetical protein
VTSQLINTSNVLSRKLVNEALNSSCLESDLRWHYPTTGMYGIQTDPTLTLRKSDSQTFLASSEHRSPVGSSADIRHVCACVLVCARLRLDVYTVTGMIHIYTRSLRPTNLTLHTRACTHVVNGSGRGHGRGGDRRWDEHSVDKRGGGTAKAGAALPCAWWYPRRQTSEYLLARYDLGLRPSCRGWAGVVCVM